MTSSEHCEDDGNAVVEVSDLGPSDIEYATSANVTLTMPVSGSFHLCYKLHHASMYEQLGSQFLTFTASARTITQSVTFASLSSCTVYDGSQKQVFEIGFAMSAGIYSDGSLHDGHFMQSECSFDSRRTSPSVGFEITVPNSDALSVAQSSLTTLNASTLVSAIQAASDAGNADVTSLMPL